MVLISATNACLQRLLVPVAILISVIFVLSSFYTRSSFLPYTIVRNDEPAASMSLDSMPQIVKALYGPVLHPITAPSFTDESGDTYHLNRDPRYTKKLGKKILILDIDTRPMTEEGQVFGDQGVKWPGLQPIAAGILSHYMYATIHGYDYRFVRAPEMPDRHVTWAKVPFLREALMSHELVIFLDQDALFHYPAIPMEWLLNYWNHSSETLLMVADDPDLPFNRDDKGDLFRNTGFIVAQNSSRTHELFEAWNECPRDTRFPGCSHYAYQWPHEQGALTTHIKPVFDRPEDIHSLPCSEANGSPMVLDKAGPGCGGVFVRHFWTDGKGHPPMELADNVMRYFTEQLHRSFVRERPRFFVDASHSEAA